MGTLPAEPMTSRAGRREEWGWACLVLRQRPRLGAQSHSTGRGERARMPGHTAQDAGSHLANRPSVEQGEGALSPTPSRQRAVGVPGQGCPRPQFPSQKAGAVQEPRTSRGLPAASGTPGGRALFSCEGPSTSCMNHSQMGASGSFPPAPALGGGGAFPGKREALPHLPGAPTRGALMGPAPLGTPPYAPTCQHQSRSPRHRSRPGGATGMSQWGERAQVGP